MTLTAEDCSCASVDLALSFLQHSDMLVAKALAVSEVAQIARVEVRTRQFLVNKWRLLADQAAGRAGKRIAGGGTLKQAYSIVDKTMGGWASSVEKGFTSEITNAYRLARKAGWKKASGQTKASLSYHVANFEDALADGKEKIRKARQKPKGSTARVNPVFDLPDERAISDLHSDQMIWVGGHYGQNVRETIRQSVEPSVLQGLSAKEAGELVRSKLAESLRIVSVPGGFHGADTKYFEGLAANTITNARVRGQIRSFSQLEIVTYEIVNPMDDRTSEICKFMNGKKFTVQQAIQQIEKESGATDPDFIKKNHPWLSIAELRELSSSPGHVSRVDSKALAESGLALPTYHWRCRSTVDIV